MGDAVKILPYALAAMSQNPGQNVQVVDAIGIMEFELVSGTSTQTFVDVTTQLVA